MDGQDQLQYLEGLQSSEKFLGESIACREAERQYQELIAQNESGGSYKASNHGSKDARSKDEATPKSSLACEIANVREKIKTFLKNGDIRSPEILCETLGERMREYSQQHEELKSTLAKTTGTLNALAEKFENLLTQLGKLPIKITMQPDGQIQCASKDSKSSDQGVKASPAKQEVKASSKVEPEDDDDIDLFGSDEETEEEAKLKADRLKAYENKKAKKPALVAKSSVVLDVKPWDDETDMKELENAVRKIETDGLKWGAGKLVPLAYGIQKFQIVAIVEDDKVSIDWLQETIQEIEDLVQSVDIAAFNKL